MREQRGCGPLGSRYTEALAWAAELHHDQLRKGTRVAYLSHLMSVSALVLEDGGTEDEAIAALLHDAVEDTGAHIEAEIASRYGDLVRSVVMECSDSAEEAGAAKAPWLVRKLAYVAHLQGASLSAIRVSGADKTHNARSIVVDIAIEGGWPTFNACEHKSLWYYDEISRAVSARLPGSRTAYQLSEQVDALFASVAVASRSPVALAEPAGCGCADNAS